jgi:hypothetical protein
MLTAATRRTLARLGLAGALVVTLGASSWRACSSATPAPAPTAPAAAQPLFVFGQWGDSRHPLEITIAKSGVVTATSGSQQRRWTPRGRLSQDALAGLITLARAEGVVTRTGPLTTTGLGATHGRFITLRTPAGTTWAAVGLRRQVAFDQLYAVLLAAADVIGDGPRRDGDLTPEHHTTG